jgi:hypothetical protein
VHTAVSNTAESGATLPMVPQARAAHESAPAPPVGPSDQFADHKMRKVVRATDMVGVGVTPRVSEWTPRPPPARQKLHAPSRSRLNPSREVHSVAAASLSQKCPLGTTLEPHSRQKNHGDVCREVGMGYVCPSCCIQTAAGSAPYCDAIADPPSRPYTMLVCEEANNCMVLVWLRFQTGFCT